MNWNTDETHDAVTAHPHADLSVDVFNEDESGQFYWSVYSDISSFIGDGYARTKDQAKRDGLAFARDFQNTAWHTLRDIVRNNDGTSTVVLAGKYDGMEPDTFRHAADALADRLIPGAVLTSTWEAPTGFPRRKYTAPTR